MLTKRNEWGIKFFSKHGDVIFQDEKILMIILHKNIVKEFIEYYVKFYFSNYIFVKKYPQDKTNNIIWEFKLKEKDKKTKNAC